MLRRARDAPHGEMYDDRGRVHHQAEGHRNSLPPPYCGGGTRAQL